MNLNFFFFNEYGIASWTDVTISLDNVIIDGNSQGENGIRIAGNSTGTIINSTVKNNTIDGIRVFDSSNLFIEDSFSKNNGNNGMNVSASSNALIYGGNEFSFNKNGVTVYHNSSVPINGNNQFSNNTDSGVSLSRSSSFENWSGVQTFENNPQLLLLNYL